MFKKGDIVEIVGKEYEVIGVELEACDKPIVRIADRYWANGVGDLQPVYELHDRNRRKMKKVGDAFMTKVQNVYWSNGAGDLHHGGFEDLKEEQLPDQLKAICPWLKECEFGCTNSLFEKDGRYGIALELEWDPDECRRDDFIKIGETKTAIAINLIVIMGYPVIVELIPPEDSIIGYILRIFIPTDKMKYEDYQKIGKKVEEILDALW